MNFFRTVHTLCTRTSAFPELLKTPVWRAILHGLLLLVLCPLIVATVQTCKEKDACSESVQRLEQESGGFGFNGEAMSLGSSFGERHYVFDLFGVNTRLDYVTGRKEILALKADHWKEKQGLLLTKEKGIFWVKTPDASFLFWEVPADVIKAYFLPDTATGDTSEKIMKIAADSSSALRSSQDLLAAATATLPEAKETTAEKTPEFTRLETETIRTMLLTLFWSLAFMQIFTECFFMLLFGGLCFAFMEFLYLRMMPNKLPFGKIYMLTLYAMFPAIVIASLSVMLGQTFLSFQTVFLIAFFIYQLFSFRHLGRFLNPPDKRKQDDFTDDDF